MLNQNLQIMQTNTKTTKPGFVCAVCGASRPATTLEDSMPLFLAGWKLNRCPTHNPRGRSDSMTDNQTTNYKVEYEGCIQTVTANNPPEAKLKFIHDMRSKVPSIRIEPERVIVSIDAEFHDRNKKNITR